LKLKNSTKPVVQNVTNSNTKNILKELKDKRKSIDGTLAHLNNKNTVIENKNTLVIDSCKNYNTKNIPKNRKIFSKSTEYIYSDKPSFEEKLRTSRKLSEPSGDLLKDSCGKSFEKLDKRKRTIHVSKNNWISDIFLLSKQIHQ